jgi:hypothetical protein
MSDQVALQPWNPSKSDSVEVKLFVGRFPISLSDDELIEIFEPYCTVFEFIRLKPKVKDMQTGCGLLKVGRNRFCLFKQFFI